MTDKIISFEELKKHSIEKEIEKFRENCQLSEIVSIDGIIGALQDAYIRANIIDDLHFRKAAKRMADGLEPNPCFNIVCPHYTEIDENFRTNYCKLEYQCHGCLYKMNETPPSSLDFGYDDMPSHKEALTILGREGIIESKFKELLEDYKKYENSKAPNQYERSRTEIKGITMRTLHDCVINAFMSFIENPHVSKIEQEVLNDWGVNIANQTTFEVEKAMKIWPNLKIL